VAKVTHRVHGIVELRAAEVFSGFGKRRDKVRMLGAGQRDHGKSMRERSKVLLQLVRRPAGGDEMDFVEIETAVGGARDGKMAVVDGIEGAAKERDTARVMFSGGAVRLRSGQCFSRKKFSVVSYQLSVRQNKRTFESAPVDFLMNS
jgi:hypothetical protein